MKCRHVIASAVTAAFLLTQMCTVYIPAGAEGREGKAEFTAFYNEWITVEGERIAARSTIESGSLTLEAGKPASLTLQIPRSGTYWLALEYEALADIVLESTLLVSMEGAETRTQLLSLWQDATKDYRTDRYGNELPAEQETSQEPVLDYVWDQATISCRPVAYTLEAGDYTVTLTSEDADIRLFQLLAVVPAKTVSYKGYAEGLEDTAEGTDFIVVEGEDYVVKSDSYIRAASESNSALYPYDYRRKRLNILDGSSFKTVGQKVIYGFKVETAGVYAVGFRYSQNYKEDLPAYADLSVDGKTLFSEMNSMAFGYTGIRYANTTLTAGEQPAGIYLEEGWHTLSLQLDGTPVQAVTERLTAILNEVSEIGLELKKVAGTSASEYRTWDIESYIPGVTEKLRGFHAELLELYKSLSSEEASSPAAALNIRLSADNLEKLLENPNKIPANLDLLNEGSGSVSQMLADQITTLTGQNLSIDRIYIYGESEELPKAEAGFFAGLLDGIKRFFYTLFVDRDTAASQGKTLKVWMNYPIYYMDTLQSMVDTQFTPETGISVQFSTMPDQQRLILANATQSTPDVIMGVQTKIPYDLGLRGAAVNLMEFPDFSSYIQEEYTLESLTPYMLGDQIFGITETQEFYVLAYRKDILESLQLDIPQTWDDVADMMPTLRRNSMNFYLQLSGYSGVKPLYSTIPFFTQAGASVFSEDGTKTALNSEAGLRGFETLTDLYRLYSVQQVVSSFYNSFRYGQIPIGIASYGDYVKIKTAAPEIAGLWGITEPPGFLQEDGSINRFTIAASTACAIMQQSDQPEESWEFLKWWLSSEVQAAFGNTLQTTYGPEYLWNSANREAFAQLSFPEEDMKVILSQWAIMKEIPQHPAQYIVEREISDAWTNVVINGEPARIALDNAASNINREISRKLEEFGYVDGRGNILRPYVIYSVEEVLKGGSAQ